MLLIRRPVLLLLDQPLHSLTSEDQSLLVQVLHDLPESTAVLSTATTRSDADAVAADITVFDGSGRPGDHVAPGGTPVNDTRPDLPTPGAMPW